MPEKCVYEYIDEKDSSRRCNFKPDLNNNLCSQLRWEECSIVVRIKDYNSRVAQSSAKYQDSEKNLTPTQIKEATDLINASRSPFGPKVLSSAQSSALYTEPKILDFQKAKKAWDEAKKQERYERIAHLADHLFPPKSP